MDNELPARIVIGNFSDLKHKINNKLPYVIFSHSDKIPSKL